MDTRPVLAPTCAAARDAARLERFTVVVADMVLPDGDGLELLGEVKRAYGCRTILLTGMDEPDDGAPAAVDLWVTKPVHVASFHAAVGRMMSA